MRSGASQAHALLLANDTGNVIGHGTRKGCHSHETNAQACQAVSWEWQGLPLPGFPSRFASQCHSPTES